MIKLNQKGMAISDKPIYKGGKIDTSWCFK
jgi:hypothetical protein